MKYTQEQQAIINSKAQYINVTAGAGCGKTTTIIGYCQQHHRDRIAAITFTRDATQHLQQVLPTNVTAITLDSFVLQMLNRTDQYHYQLDQNLQQLAHALYPQSGYHGTFNDYLSFLQNMLIDRTSQSPYLPKTTHDEQLLNRVYRQPVKQYYHTPLLGLLDDTYYVTNETANVALSMRLQTSHDDHVCPFDTIIIDESQDISALQYYVLMQLKKYYPNLKIIMIGDLSQSIYRFRNASPENILAFQKFATNYHLTINFRAKNQGLLIIPNTLLQTNHDNIDHIQLHAYQHDTTIPPQTMWVSDYQRLQAYLQEYQQQQRTVGIIANTNHDLNQVMINLHINYQNVDPFKLCDRFINDVYWLQHRHPQQLHDYCQQTALPQQLWQSITQLQHQNKQYLTQHHDEQQAIIKIWQLIDTWFKQPSQAVYQQIIQQNDLIQQLPVKKQPYVTPNLFCGTVHAAKGLEFDNVIYIPNDNYLVFNNNADRHEQENRIYVAMTRAIDNNIIFWRFLHNRQRWELPEFQAIAGKYQRQREREWRYHNC